MKLYYHKTDGEKEYFEVTTLDDAEFVVRACNNHDKLLEAFKALLIQFERFAKLTYEAEGHPHDLEHIFHKWPEVINARTAIAEAEKGDG